MDVDGAPFGRVHARGCGVVRGGVGRGSVVARVDREYISLLDPPIDGRRLLRLWAQKQTAHID